MNTKKLYRVESEKMLGGVCAGIGRYFDIDPTLVRLATVLLGVFLPQTILLYLVLWLVIPPDPTYTPPTPPSSGGPTV